MRNKDLELKIPNLPSEVIKLIGQENLYKLVPHTNLWVHLSSKT